MSWLDQVKWDAQGLVPVIAQERSSGDVVMFAWMNREALAQTAELGRAVYFSRSRNKLWFKGEESGHVQTVHELRIDCDNDVVLLKITQEGHEPGIAATPAVTPAFTACSKTASGWRWTRLERSRFHLQINTMSETTNPASVEGALARLAAVIESRKTVNGGDPEKAMWRACCIKARRFPEKDWRRSHRSGDGGQGCGCRC